MQTPIPAKADVFLRNLANDMQDWPADGTLVEKDKTLFISQLLQGEPGNDLLNRPQQEAIATIRKLWDSFQIRRFEDIQIHVDEDNFGQEDRIDITIMQRQIPFITDSVLNRLRVNHLSVSVMLNATIKVRRDDDGKLLSLHEEADYSPDTQQDKILYLQCEYRGEEFNKETIFQEITNTIRDVQAAVEDWRPMQAHIADTINELENYPDGVDGEEAYETAEFLSFLQDGDFTFLGYREHNVRREQHNIFFDVDDTKSLGLLRDKEFLLFDGLIVDELIPKVVQECLASPKDLMMVLKANRLSTVHRHVHMDVIIIKHYDNSGNVESLRLFAGLFTARCYAKPVDQIPYLKRKINAVLLKSDLDADTHAWRALRHVMESFSRDELFQIDIPTLYDHATSIVRLNNRPDIDVFVRRDALERYFSVLVFLPKDQYNTSLRLKTQQILETTLQGKVVAHYMTVDEKPLARLQYMVSSGTPLLPDFDLSVLRSRLINACTPWFDRLKIATLERFGKVETQRLLHSLTNAFSVSYQDQVPITHAVDDLPPLQAVLSDKEFVVKLHHYESDPQGQYRIKFYKRDEEAKLSELLPMLDKMGFDCLYEYSHEFHSSDADKPNIWLHELVGTIQNFSPESFEDARALFAEAFEIIWRGKIESDSFNSLILTAGLTWREANLFRAYVRYLDLANYPLGTNYIGQVLGRYSLITRRIKDLFIARMDPDLEPEKSELAVAGLLVEIDHHLENVEKLDEDRVLRSLLNLVRETLRTNYFHRDKNGELVDILALKFNATNISDLPKPRPYREIFIYHKRLESVHLRGGPIARGGIRWSDRYEDFRTEILGLIKAQTVKNAVIVPVGAKGGFICKNQLSFKTPPEQMEEGIACYKLMINTMLSITDNLIDGQIIPPQRTVRLDGDDPYLVVAADKGTASFSDTANKISLEHNFWLGDAFASGGSQGYDHKEMGITARGAWECIKRHFRELGKDIQTEEFTVAGVGDMSGDVFGNGLLLSEKTKLIAAFDHRHIFIDPNPDPAVSFSERKRLFEKPGSSWMDYNPELLSKGGAIYNRYEKSLAITPEIRELLDIDKDRVTSVDLLQAILKAPVELLYFGGIGTYVKASHQSHEQVGDKANDALRVDANALRCKVMGEGANLGVTQAARIEFSQYGGKVDTDFIDNSGGVDTSDHEVNIKILLQPMVDSGVLPIENRNHMLKEMTEDVAAHVLKNNYDQSLALSIQEKYAPEEFSSHVDFIRHLERQGLMDRRLEGLPDDDDIQQRLQAHRGLTRPELCVVIAYAKMTLFTQLMKTDLPDEPEVSYQAIEYFPTLLQEKYRDDILGHKLKRDIVATEIVNVIVNRMGPVFISGEVVRGGNSLENVVRAWLVARSVFNMRDLWAEIDNLDNKIPADVQLELYSEIVDIMEQGTKWFLQHHGNDLSLKTLVPLYCDQLKQLHDVLPDIVPAGLQSVINQKKALLENHESLSDSLQQRLLQLPLLLAGCNVVYMTQQGSYQPDEVAKVYFNLNERFHLSVIDAQLDSIPAVTAWDQEVIETLQNSFQKMGGDLTMQFLGSGSSLEQLNEWLAQRQSALDAVDAVLDNLNHSNTVDLALLTVVSQRFSRYVYQEVS